MIKQRIFQPTKSHFVMLIVISISLPEDFEYEIKDNVVTIKEYKGNNSAVIVPATYKGMPVRSIGDSIFYGCSNLKSITIGNVVANINDFNKCEVPNRWID